jgi:hypothetical protein
MGSPRTPVRVACEALAVETIGTGANLWRVRVDFALDDDGRRVGRAVDELRGLLQDEARVANANVGGDQGLGVKSRPVVGLLFRVDADDVGEGGRDSLASSTACRSSARRRA